MCHGVILRKEDVLLTLRCDGKTCDTDIRLAMTAAIRRYFVENPSAFDPRAYLKAARAAAYEMCKARFLAFGCEGQAARIKAIPLSVMASRYADGTLAQKVN